MAAQLSCQVLLGLTADGAPCRLTGPAGSLQSGRRCCLSLYCKNVSGTAAVWALLWFPEQQTRASCPFGSFPSLPTLLQLVRALPWPPPCTPPAPRLPEPA